MCLGLDRGGSSENLMQGCHPDGPCLRIWAAERDHGVHDAVHWGQVRVGHKVPQLLASLDKTREAICKITVGFRLCSALNGPTTTGLRRKASLWPSGSR